MLVPSLRSALLLVFVVSAAMACASGSASDAGGTGAGGGGEGGDASTGGKGGGQHPGDGGSAGTAGSGGGGGCTLGTAEHCGACDVVCPGEDDAGTQRVCTTDGADGTCDIVCLGEFYDVDGDLENGCEAADPTVHATLASATPITLPDVDDAEFESNPLNLLDYVYGDARTHAEAPVSRPLGREDWWRVTAVGAGQGGAEMAACLGLTGFPADNEFEVCVSDIGVQSFVSAGCATATGDAASACVGAPAATDAGTPYYVRVRKLAGTNSNLGYSLFLRH